jgi:hypothetical protein
VSEYQTLRVDGMPRGSMIKLIRLRALEGLTNAELIVSMIDHRYDLVMDQVRREAES